MSESPSAATNTQLTRVLDEYLLALERGTAPTRDELLARHPELARELAEALLGLDFVRVAAPRLGGGEPLETPRTLGDYRVLREVGRGGMAVVYEAEQISLGRRVALKVLPFAAMLDPKMLQRFKNEALAAAHLHHPHIVPVYGVGSERGIHYYAMQYVEGQSLAQVIREMQSEPEQRESATPVTTHGSHRESGYVRFVTELGVQAAEALGHAHELGVIHRDVKPGNLLVDQSGALWITDFGLARTLRDTGLTITGELLGTVRYMSPEQALAGPAPVDHRTDVYSLGVTLFELLTLEHAIPGDDPHVVLQNTLHHEPPPPRRINPSLSFDLETVLLKSMSKDPGSRYATAQEMADDLRRCLLDRPVLARRPSLMTRAARWSRRHRGLVAAVVAMLFVGVGALALGARQEERKTRKALEQAKTNLGIARDAVDRFLAAAAINSFVDAPFPPPSRRALLESALEFYVTTQADSHSFDERALILHALRRYDEAAECARRLVALAPDRAEALLRLAHMLVHVSGAKESLALLDRAIELDPGSADAWHERSKAHFVLDQNEDALADADRAIAIETNRPEFHASRGNALQQLGQSERALAAFDRCLELEKFNAEALHGRGNALQSLGKPEEALAAYDAAIAVQPEHAGSHYERGETLMTMRRPDLALAAYDEALRLAPDAMTHHARGMALLALGKAEEAAEAFRRSLAIKPESASTHYNLASALREMGDRDGAIAENRKAIDLKPDYAKAHCNLAFLLKDAGEADEAKREFDEALRHNPELPEACLGLGNIDLDAGRFDDAIAKYRDAISHRAGYAKAWSNLGLALRRCGRFEEAVTAYRRGFELGCRDPGEETIVRIERFAALEKRLDRVLSGAEPLAGAVEHLDLAYLLHAKSRYAEAAKAFRDTFAADPSLADDRQWGHRYNAACCASLAAAAGGTGAEEWRRRALEWLRADLQARADAGALATTANWSGDPDLAHVRDRLDLLPDAEREEWTRFWADVAGRAARSR